MLYRNNNFDFLRFFAASVVLFSHCYPLTGHQGAEPIAAITGIDSGGGLAVAVFFVISGYLITGSYINSKNIADYVVKRVLRLFPALTVCVILTILVLGPALTTLPFREYLRHPFTHAYWSNIWLFISYPLPGVFEANVYPNVMNGSLWTLPVEVLMYAIVLVMGIVRALNTRAMAVFLGVCWLLYFRIVPAFDLQSTILLEDFPVAETAKLACFYFGGALLYMHSRDNLKSIDVAVLAIFAIIATRGANAQQAAYVMLGAVIVITFAFVSLGPIGRFGKYGDVSYGLYIYAFPIQQLVVMVWGNSITPTQLFTASYPMTLLAAFCSWHLVEKRAIAAKGSRPFQALVGAWSAIGIRHKRSLRR
ncbi:acyltransferase [Paraburkholderia sp. SIMBA_049]